MEFEEKLEFAVKEVEGLKVAKWSVIPPGFALLYSKGVQVPPPHYNSLVSNLLCFLVTLPYAAPIFVRSNLWVWPMFLAEVWSNWDYILLHPGLAVFKEVAMGTLMAVIVSAALYQDEARRLKLTPWNEISGTVHTFKLG